MRPRAFVRRQVLTCGISAAALVLVVAVPSSRFTVDPADDEAGNPVLSAQDDLGNPEPTHAPSWLAAIVPPIDALQPPSMACVFESLRREDLPRIVLTTSCDDSRAPPAASA